MLNKQKKKYSLLLMMLEKSIFSQMNCADQSGYQTNYQEWQGFFHMPDIE